MMRWIKRFEKRYRFRTLRPLWLILPFVPLICYFYNFSTIYFLGVFLFIYFLPLLIVLYASMFIAFILPSSFDSIVHTIVILMIFAYCGLLAYYANRKCSQFSTRLSLIQILAVYILILTPISISVTSIFGVPASSHNPIYDVHESQHLIRRLKSYRDDFGVGISRQYFIRIEYQGDFLKPYIDRFELSPYPLNDIPAVFWDKNIVWWQPNKTSAAKVYISEKFTFDQKIFHGGSHVFIYDQPSEQVCYIWYKNIF
jgi:hypothetical protein